VIDLTVAKALDMLHNREISSKELVESAFARIEEVDSKVKAFMTLTRDQAIAAAAVIDARRLNGEEVAPLAGIPMALKDNLCTKGVLTTCSSRILHNFVPPYDAAVVELLRDAGAIMVGKTNMDEFAMGSSTENSGFFTTRNPWDTERVPGGSSGGSAAAVAAGEALFSLGSDTGGSIRQPAAFCGVVGMKPTYGRVSRYGLVAFASSLDQIGTFTMDIKDCALLMNIIAAHDKRDTTSADVSTPDYTACLDGDVKGMKIGVPREYFTEGINPAISASVRKAIDVLVSLGAVADEISLPHTEYGIPAYYLIAPAEASSNLARYDGVQYGLRVEADNLIDMYKKTRSQGFGPEVKRRIMLGTYALSSGYYDAYYLKALKVRTLIKQDFDQAFREYDIIITPTTPSVAFKVGEVEDPLTMYMHDVLTIPANMAGLPALSMPCGFVDGLPVGLQFMGKHFDESTILRMAFAYEQNSGMEKKRPEISVRGGAA
jgi:aspartyl-tRNA(Asn)/glutamyl-tRNA(Gln) amidotransferase subunit A